MANLLIRVKFIRSKIVVNNLIYYMKMKQLKECWNLCKINDWTDDFWNKSTLKKDVTCWLFDFFQTAIFIGLKIELSITYLAKMWQMKIHQINKVLLTWQNTCTDADKLYTIYTEVHALFYVQRSHRTPSSGHYHQGTIKNTLKF